MFLSTICGEKLSIKINTKDEALIRIELHKKYGFDLESIYLHWNGYKYIVGFFNNKNIENDIIYQKNLSTQGDADLVDIPLLTDTLINKNKEDITDREKELICKNLDKIFKELKNN
ncbi:hypothetical protein NGRA_1407 [Nosema granulosis]|uniref:Uncharacterized protein n=1 Tax=Nosema granulosis TaxID=83296 RepID=A0A9P6GYI8_9MICR|nr:hypothetical protein NGRA_1407 [Nosema granulosis]